MAKILPGPNSGEIRGQMGGVVYSRNRFGMYVRNNSSPVNPQSARQNAIRAAFTQIAQRWRDTLTAAERQGWEDYAQETPLTDVFGLKQVMTGLNMYARFNVPWTDIGQTAVDAPPVTPGEATMVIPTMTGDTVAGIQITAMAPALANADRYMWLNSSAPVSQARNFYNGPFTRGGYIEGDRAWPLVIVGPGSVAIGQRWYFKFRALISDGRTGPPAIATVDILA